CNAGLDCVNVIGFHLIPNSLISYIYLRNIGKNFYDTFPGGIGRDRQEKILYPFPAHFRPGKHHHVLLFYITMRQFAFKNSVFKDKFFILNYIYYIINLIQLFNKPVYRLWICHYSNTSRVMVPNTGTSSSPSSTLFTTPFTNKFE